MSGRPKYMAGCWFFFGGGEPVRLWYCYIYVYTGIWFGFLNSSLVVLSL